MDKTAIIYIHGKGGNISEAERYKPLFPDFDILGFDYKSNTPWEAKEEFTAYFNFISEKYAEVYLIANSIGAYFTLNSVVPKNFKEAFFISPVVDMEKLISDMMLFSNVNEEDLKIKGEIETSFGETLSWKYLRYVRENKIKWSIKTHIIYGDKDNLTSFSTITEFANRINATLDILEGGEHWFHNEEQMKFIDDKIKKYGR